MSLNSLISYLYRDSDNYKVHNVCIINGLLTSEQQQRILDCLHEGEWFIPNAVGLPEKRFDTWDDQSDHPWFELDEYSFETTHGNPTVDVTPAGLVKAFEACKGKWQKFECDAIARLAPMVVSELIQEATERSGGQEIGQSFGKDLDFV